jgi:hypothetical protein
MVGSSAFTALSALPCALAWYPSCGQCVARAPRHGPSFRVALIAVPLMAIVMLVAMRHDVTGGFVPP